MDPRRTTSDKSGKNNRIAAGKTGLAAAWSPVLFCVLDQIRKNRGYNIWQLVKLIIFITYVINCYIVVYDFIITVFTPGRRSWYA
jgi:hypothetical protein